MRGKSSPPYKYKGSWPIEGTTQSNLSNTSTFYRLLSLYLYPTFPTSTCYSSLVSMAFEDALAGLPSLGKTLRALAPTGSLPGERSSDFAVLHRRTGLTGYHDRSDRSEHRHCNCTVAHRAIKRVRVLVLDWRQQLYDLFFPLLMLVSLSTCAASLCE